MQSKILSKKTLAPSVVRLTVSAPRLARHAKPGQFIILRACENGERIPLTISDYDENEGTVSVVFQEVGKSTKLLGKLNEGDVLPTFVGPLGRPSHLDGIKRAAVIGGGLGSAIAYPQAKALFKNGASVDLIAGFRNKDVIILEDEMRAASTRLFITTDDGSNGNKGFVTDVLRKLLESGEKYDEVIAIGPLPMMKFVSLLTKEYGIKTTVSMNPIMIDGTGMCGGCRLTVGGETKFACVDGPDFDGHLVDYDEMMRRNSMYKDMEREADCNLTKGVE